jgi:hypothetical protein
MRVGKLYAMLCLCFVTTLPAAAGIWVSAPRFDVRNCDLRVAGSLHSQSQFAGLFEGCFANRNIHRFEFASLCSERIKP